MLELKEMGVRARQAARTLATAGEAEKIRFPLTGQTGMGGGSHRQQTRHAAGKGEQSGHWSSCV